MSNFLWSVVNDAGELLAYLEKGSDKIVYTDDDQEKGKEAARDFLATKMLSIADDPALNWQDCVQTLAERLYIFRWINSGKDPLYKSPILNAHGRSIT